MYTFVDIGLMTLFIIMFTGMYFIYERILTFKTFSFLKIKNYVLDSVNGAFFGLFALLIKLLLMQIDEDFNIPIFILVALTLLVIKNVNVSLMSILIPLIFFAIKFNHEGTTYYLIAMLFASMLVYIIVDYFEKSYWPILSLFITVFAFGIIGLIVFNLAFNIPFERQLFETSLFLPFMLGYLFFPFRSAIRTSISANILFESINFTYSKYYRHTLAPKAIGSFIAETNTKRAIFGLVRIDTSAENSIDKKEVIETVLTKFEKLISENSLLYSYDENTFGFFVPREEIINVKTLISENKKAERPMNSQIRDIELILRDLERTYNTESGSFVTTTVKAGISVYGIQSGSVDELENNALFALSRIVGDAKIEVYNPREEIEKMNDGINLSLLDQTINLNNFSSSFIKLYPLKNKDDSLTYVEVKNNDEYAISESVDELVRINNWKDIFDRFYSAEAIPKSNGQTLMLEYSPILSKEDLTIDKFLITLSNKGFNGKYIWVFSGRDINKNNIKKLANREDFAYAIKDVEFIDSSLIKKLNPLYVINDESSKFINNPTQIITTISDENQLIEAIKKGFDYVGGEFLDINQIAKKPNKQSKIYIEKTMSRIGEN